MNKAYPNKVNWQNTPSTATPLGATNLNKMSDALDTIDDRVVTFDTSKANTSDVTTMATFLESLGFSVVDGKLNITWNE